MSARFSSCVLTCLLDTRARSVAIMARRLQKTVKDMLRKVVGAQIVEDKNEYISAEVDRIVASDVANLVAKYMSAEREGSRV